MKSLFNDDNIDDIFRNELKDHRVSAPKGVWDKINSQLQVKRIPRLAYLLASVFITGLLAVGFWSINSLNSTGRNSIVKNKSAGGLVVTPSVNTTPFNNVAQSVSVSTGTKVANQLSNPAQNKINTTVQSQTKNVLPGYSQTATASVANTTTEDAGEATSAASSGTVIEHNSELQNSYIQLQNMPSKTAVNMVVADNNIAYDNIEHPMVSTTPATLNNKSIKGFYAGINGSVNTIWVLDRVALRDNNFNYQITPGYTYGVQAGYNFSNSFGLETGLTLNARDGQNYIFYLNNVEPENKSVVLNYSEIPLIAKLKIPQISGFTGMPLVLNINFGASYGYLRHAYTYVSGDKAGSRNQYPTNQINALAGFSYDIYTHHAYSYSIGFMAEYGINTTYNDNQGATNTPLVSSASRYANGSDFGNPHNLSVGITAAINYNFSLFSR